MELLEDNSDEHLEDRYKSELLKQKSKLDSLLIINYKSTSSSKKIDGIQVNEMTF